MQMETKSGTYKRPEPEDIADIVKMVRGHFGWKQFALAQEAGVTQRTIERLEAGERMSDETLNKVSNALKLRERAFTQPSYCPSDEELSAMVKKTKEDYTHTPLHDLLGPRELEHILSAHAYLVDGSNADDELAGSIAAVKDYVQEAGDIYNDATHTDRLIFCQKLLAMIRDIEAHGCTARWGRYVTDDKFNMGVLIFFKTIEVQTDQYFRHAIVPRSMVRSMSN